MTSPRSRANSSSRCSCSSSARRLRRILSAVFLFESCERSFWTLTTIPVGRCVMRTAESVLLTCWPSAHVLRPGDRQPAPLGRRGDRADDHLGEGRVPTVRLVERREPHETMYAALGL